MYSIMIFTANKKEIWTSFEYMVKRKQKPEKPQLKPCQA